MKTLEEFTKKKVAFDPAKNWDKAATELNNALKRLPSRDIRDTKESIESDGGKKLMQQLQKTFDLHKAAVAAYKKRGY